jgi:signal peptidase I
MQPWWLDWTAGLFPVIAIVFVLRSFLFEPFKIPSGSMIPTLLVGDLILVNKFTYGIRLPVINKKITEGNKPQRGDVMVFRYPPQPSWTTSSAWWACPVMRWPINKRLTINGKECRHASCRTFWTRRDALLQAVRGNPGRAAAPPSSTTMCRPSFRARATSSTRKTAATAWKA